MEVRSGRETRLEGMGKSREELEGVEADLKKAKGKEPNESDTNDSESKNPKKSNREEGGDDPKSPGAR